MNMIQLPRIAPTVRTPIIKMHHQRRPRLQHPLHRPAHVAVATRGG
jgi:hypothetical protein